MTAPRQCPRELVIESKEAICPHIHGNKQNIKIAAPPKGARIPGLPRSAHWSGPRERRLQPYDSLIWDIETLHFTTPAMATSICVLGTTLVRALATMLGD